MCFYKPSGIPSGPSMGGGYVIIHTRRNRGRSYSFVLEALYRRHGFRGPPVVGRVALIIRWQAICVATLNLVLYIAWRADQGHTMLRKRNASGPRSAP
jgi:hypothetical protein